MSRFRKSETDFELNLAPIIDCFTVLVTFMLASSSFISIAWMEAQLPGATASAEAASTPVLLTVHLEAEGMRIGVKGRASMSSRIEGRDIASDRIESELKTLNASFPKVDGLVLTADPAVEYERLVSTFSTAQKVVPNIAMGGQGQ